MALNIDIVQPRVARQRYALRSNTRKLTPLAGNLNANSNSLMWTKDKFHHDNRTPAESHGVVSDKGMWT